MATDQSLKTCVDWLIRCSLLPRDHWLASGKAQVNDLAHQLKDGVLLCHLLNRLHPSAIDPKEFSQRPQMSQFLCLKNSRAFVQACRSVFKMRDDDLFDPHNLYNPASCGKVLHTLSVLSKTPLALRSGITPFNLTDTYYTNMKAFDKPFDDYVTEDGLENEVGVSDSDDDDDDAIYENHTEMEPDPDKGIYDDLCSIRQCQFRSEQQDTQPKTKRDMCIQELVETEKKYVDVLNTIRTVVAYESNGETLKNYFFGDPWCQKAWKALMLCNDAPILMGPNGSRRGFMRPLKDCRQLVSPSEFDTIFMGIEKLSAIHTDFKADLMRACEKNSTKSIPDCFVTCKEKFLYYGEYCANLTLAQETIDKLCQSNPVLQAKVQELEMTANEGRFRIRDMLSIPMQRVLKYHLLLKELIKNTKEDDMERKMLEKALDETQDLSLFVNEVKRDRETLTSISLVSSSIVDLPKNTHLENNGRLLMDGEMKVKMSTESGHQTRHIFLFDKVMIMCKTLKGDAYSYKNALVLKYYDVSPNVVKEKGHCGVTLSERSGKDSYMILSKKEEQIKKWLEVIRLAQDNENPLFARNAKHDFEMHTFNKPTICDVCRKLLRGVFFQGYRCKKTNMNAHKECLKAAEHMDGPPTGKLPDRQSFRTMPRSNSATTRTMKTVSRYSGIPPPSNGRSALAFEVGETIEILSDSDPDWLEGMLRGWRGFFPRTAVWDYRAPSYEVPMPFAHTLSRRESAPVSPCYSPASPRFPMRHSYSTAVDSVDGYPWYAGMLSRDIAIQKLNPLPNGSYLIRISDRAGSNRGIYAISIKFDDKVMHMKVSQDDDGKFYLGASVKFQTLQKLVEHYQQVSLERVYPELKSVLAIPFKHARRPGRRVIGYCSALYDYSATEPSQLSLRKDEMITILSKADESKGWWRGESSNGKVGIFPVTYVQEVNGP